MSESTAKKVVTRYAPSPTGAQHVGGARTALFNWAYARKHGGEFILRIEDTDQKRSTDASTVGIMRDLAWLGLDWDQGPDPASSSWTDGTNQIGDNSPYFQSQRLDIYSEHLQKLIDAGLAYECFKTPDELNAARAAARAEKRNYKYDSADSLALTAEQKQTWKNEGRPFVWRFRMPVEDVTIRDEVRGEVVFPAGDHEDLVIFKADGFPTYHFAVVVDDALMGVNHIIRGQEHLSNTPKHVALQDALGFERPVYAHLPLIFNPDDSKMGKRDKAKAARQAAKAHMKELDDTDAWLDKVVNEYAINRQYFGAVDSEVFDKGDLEKFLKKKNDRMDITLSIAHVLELELPEIDVADFRASGYLPSSVCNYLSLLGWNPGTDLERFDNAFLAQYFGLERVGKSNSKFDRDKLFRFNAEAIAALEPDVFVQKYTEYCKEQSHAAGNPLVALSEDEFVLFAKMYQPRARTFKEPMEIGAFFFTDDESLVYEEKAVNKFLLKNDGEGIGILKEFRETLAAIDPWSGEAAHAAIKAFCEAKELGMGKVAQPLRIAIAGGTVTPPIDQTLELLGKKTALLRIDSCLIEFT